MANIIIDKGESISFAFEINGIAIADLQDFQVYVGDWKYTLSNSTIERDIDNERLFYVRLNSNVTIQSTGYKKISIAIATDFLGVQKQTEVGTLKVNETNQRTYLDEVSEFISATFVIDINTDTVTSNAILENIYRGQDGLITEIIAGTNITVDNTDPSKPIVNSTAYGSTTTEEFYCIPRLATNGTVWEFVEDSNHEPSSNIQSIITDPSPNFNFRINHENGYAKIGSLNVNVDETYASMGLTIGASVGKTNSLFRICRNGFSIRMAGSANNLAFANDVGQVVKNTDFDFTFDSETGVLTISHPTIVCTYGDMGMLTIQDPCPYTARFVSRTATSTKFKLYNNGILVTALSSTFKAYYTKLGTFICTNEQIGQSSANFWIRGIMKK